MMKYLQVHIICILLMIVQAATDLLVRQKQLSVGMPNDGERIITWWVVYKRDVEEHAVFWGG